VALTATLVILASGSGSNLQAILDACDQGDLDAEISLVVVNRRSAYAAERAESRGIPTHYAPLGPYRERFEDPAEARIAYDTDLAAVVAAASPDLVIQAGWMHLFSMAFLGEFPNLVVNLHPALPGQFPGAHAIDDAWAEHQRSGLDHTGVMVHLVPDEGVDNGPVIASEEIAIRTDDTRDDLEARIHSVEHRVFPTAIAQLLESR
jgi:formyltetrahydrofolate-dependent phosphoribosylglycinamide formyltransferase